MLLTGTQKNKIIPTALMQMILHNVLCQLSKKVKLSADLHWFVRGSHHALADKVLSVSLQDLLTRQVLGTVHGGLLVSGRSLSLIHFDRLSCRS